MVDNTKRKRTRNQHNRGDGTFKYVLIQTDDKAMSPMSQTYPECSDASTQENILKESCWTF